MFGYDVVIIGGGPAGLTAGLYLSRAKRRTILLEREILGGPIRNLERIENYPGFADGVSGTHLASEMVAQATKYGLKLEQAEVVGIRSYTSTRWVKCADGSGYTAKVVIIAGGAHPKKLGVPGEEELRGKGVTYCAFCDGGQFIDRVVAVCGGGDSGVTGALYMTKLASRVILVEAMPALTASAVLQEKALAHPKLEVHTGTKVTAILGQNQVAAAELVDTRGQTETVPVDGVIIYAGVEPNTGYLSDMGLLDRQGRIIVNDRMETRIPYVLAAGDIKSGSPNQIATAVSDGATAALTAEKLLQELA